MHKQYIKINNKNEIVDVFFEHQTNKFDGSEIFLKETSSIKHKINDKSITNEFGNYIFTYINGNISEIDNSTNILKETKTLKKEEIQKWFNEYETTGVNGGYLSPTLGIIIETSKSDMEKILNISNAHDMGSTIPDFYKGKSEIVNNVTPEMFKAVYLELYALYLEKWGIKQSLYTSTNNATTIEEVNDIVIPKNEAIVIIENTRNGLTNILPSGIEENYIVRFPSKIKELKSWTVTPNNGKVFGTYSINDTNVELTIRNDDTTDVQYQWELVVSREDSTEMELIEEIREFDKTISANDSFDYIFYFDTQPADYESILTPLDDTPDTNSSGNLSCNYLVEEFRDPSGLAWGIKITLNNTLDIEGRWNAKVICKRLHPTP